MKKIIIIGIILLLCLGIILYFISRTPNRAGLFKRSFVNKSKGKPEKTKKLKIISWNAAWFYGLDSEGSSSYKFKDKDFFEIKLNEAAKLLKDQEPDIIALQEVDFYSHKSHYIDQVKFLAEQLDMNYAIANSWDHFYVPFPYFPIANHFGKVSSGGAILSRFPIKSNEVTLFAKPDSNPWWYNLLYLFRYNQKVTVTINEKDFIISNVHLEAFDKKNRYEQIKQLHISNKETDVICGDFNMIPTASTKKNNFEGYQDDYTNDDSFEFMMKSDFQTTFSANDFNSNQSLYFTFPSNRPDRRLDYFFMKNKYQVLESKILSSSLSDHLPISLVIKLD